MQKNENRPGFKKTKLGKVANIYSGGTPSRTKSRYWNGDIPWVKTAQIQNCLVGADDIDEFISEEGLKKSSTKMVPEGTILMAMYGQGKTRGQVAILEIDATINQACAAIDLSTITFSLCRYTEHEQYRWTGKPQFRTDKRNIHLSPPIGGAGGDSGGVVGVGSGDFNNRTPYPRQRKAVQMVEEHAH